MPHNKKIISILGQNVYLIPLLLYLYKTHFLLFLGAFCYRQKKGRKKCHFTHLLQLTFPNSDSNVEYNNHMTGGQESWTG